MTRLPGLIEDWVVEVAYGLVRAARVLHGDPVVEEFSQDWSGARALLDNSSVYGPGGSTQRPTALLLALPLAGLPLAQAQQIWALAMLGLSFPISWALGMRWRHTALLVPLALLWPPSTWSVHQLTPV